MPARVPKANVLATECYANLAGWPSSPSSFTFSLPPSGFKEHPAAPSDSSRLLQGQEMFAFNKFC